MTHTHDHTAEELLKSHGLRKTSFRLEVLDILMQHEGNALTNQHIEQALGEHDRITLYRTLKTFEEKGIVHIAVDGDGASRYALCQHDCVEGHHHDSHAHFHCDVCGQTSCMEDMPDKISALVPSSYEVTAVRITFSGVCADCR